jgi:hypothetical protein
MFRQEQLSIIIHSASKMIGRVALTAMLFIVNKAPYLIDSVSWNF